MDRGDIMREFARKQSRGIEIGPYFAPIVPKSHGWNVLTLDVFDKAKLRERAAADRNIPPTSIPNIEEVDLLGPAHRLTELIADRGENGQIDFIISSHNFEHLPNPIAFLRACSEVLRPGAVLSMAIPDKRTCFDYFRPLSTLAPMLEAFAENRERPTATQLLEVQILDARYHASEGDVYIFSLTNDPRQIAPTRRMEEAYAGWKARIARGSKSGIYEDCHCWTFTPSSLRLLLTDLRFLGLIEFELIKIYETQGHEFFVHLRNLRGMSATPLSATAYYEERQALLHAMNWDPSVNAFTPTETQAPAQPVGTSSEVATLRTELTRLQEETNLHREETRQLQQAIDKLIATYSGTETLREEIYRLHLENKILERDNNALRTSRSWRVTAPLRFLGDALRGRRSRAG
jgi:SAM-dependent methyltransferase